MTGAAPINPEILSFFDAAGVLEEVHDPLRVVVGEQDDKGFSCGFHCFPPSESEFTSLNFCVAGNVIRKVEP